jgi:DNA-binding LacI/PurR family transcriptional regulator
VDGLIIVSLSPQPPDLERILRSRLPTVLVDARHRGLARVVANDALGGRLATDHLLGLGHRRVGFIDDIARVPMAFTSSRLRLSGHRRAMLDAGLEIAPGSVALGRHSRDDASELAYAMLGSRLRPTAIVCASDTQAAGVLEAAIALGVGVSGDLSVTGYDDLELADHLRLTTIRLPLFESGVGAVQRLLDGIVGRSMTRLREVQPISLVVRDTSAQAPGPAAPAHAGRLS